MFSSEIDENHPNHYEKLVIIGQGAFAKVFKARNNESVQRIVAMKTSIQEEVEGVDTIVVREAEILKNLNNLNVIKLLEFVDVAQESPNSYSSSAFTILEYCPYNLYLLLAPPDFLLELNEIKNITMQLLDGLQFIHGYKIVHRDLRPSNILVTSGGVVKLSDFGLAESPSSTLVRLNFAWPSDSLWYQPPEKLLGAETCSSSTDVWSLACIMVEMWAKKPLFKGKDEKDQLTQISVICGSINSESWQGVEDLPLFGRINLIMNQERKVKRILKSKVWNNKARHLIDRMLTYNPRRRMNAIYAKNDVFFLPRADPQSSDLIPMLERFKDEIRKSFPHLAEISTSDVSR